MADLSDVENTLVGVILNVIYPGGTEVPSPTGQTVKIFRGWPSNLGLNSDLASGTSNVTVFSDPKRTRETTRYPRIWREVSRVPMTLQVSVSGTTVIFGGTCLIGQIVGVEVDGQTFVVPVANGDTPATMAGKFNVLIAGSVLTGSTLAVPSGHLVTARVVSGGTASMETRRQEQDVMVGLWCPTPQARDVLAAAIDSALSLVDWLTFSDLSSGLLRYHATTEIDTSENANLYRRDLVYSIEYPTTVVKSVPAMVFGELSAEQLSLSPSGALAARSNGTPLLGAIRFDAWYDPSSTIDQQCAAALSNSSWFDRLPPNAIVTGSQVTWPLAAQAVMDAEILAAVTSGIDFWAFDSYQPNDGLSRALALYLASSLRPRLKFCMLGQSSNWADPTSSTGYSASLERDIAMMSEPGYVRVLDGRPLYLVLDASASQLAYLPGGSVSQAIAFTRTSVTGQGLNNPYIVWLSAAPLTAYDNVAAAQSAGADAAGAYACSDLEGATQSYGALTETAQADWVARAQSGFDMVGTAMTGWDQRPLIEAPQPFYPISSTITSVDYYTGGAPADIALHVAGLRNFVIENSAACPSLIGLIYAWNELVEGGWLMPTYSPAGADQSRVQAVGAAILQASLEETTTTNRIV